MEATDYNCITCKVRSCSLLSACDMPTLKAISAYKYPRSLQKGERLFSEGDPVRGICFIKQGLLKVELNGKLGRPLILQIAGRGAVFGHRANASHAFHTFSATAASDVSYCYISRNLFNKITDRSPELKRQLVNRFLDELELVEKKIVNLAHKTVREKLAEALLMIAEAYQYEETKLSFQIDFCRQEIADLADTTKEQVSKILNDFEKEGLIKCVARTFSYLDIDRLRIIAGYSSLPDEEKYRLFKLPK